MQLSPRDPLGGGATFHDRHLSRANQVAHLPSQKKYFCGLDLAEGCFDFEPIINPLTEKEWHIQLAGCGSAGAAPLAVIQSTLCLTAKCEFIGAPIPVI